MLPSKRFTAFKIKKPKLKEFTYNGKKLSNMELCVYKPELSFSEFMALQQSEPEFWSLYETYCESDVVSLLELWTKFNTQMIDLVKKVRPKLAKTCTFNSASTIGGFSMSLLRNLRKTDNLHIMAKYKQFMFKRNFVGRPKQPKKPRTLKQQANDKIQSERFKKLHEERKTTLASKKEEIPQEKKKKRTRRKTFSRFT